MKLVEKFTITCIAVMLTAGSALADDPVAYVMDLSGDYTRTDGAGVSSPLAIKAPLFNGSVITRTTGEGYLVYLDSNGRVSPRIVEAEITIKGRRGIEPKKQAVYLAYIGGTMARSGKGAAADGLVEWVPEIGAVMEKDVRDGRAALVFGPGPDSSETETYFPLVMKTAARYRIRGIDYRVVRNTMVTAEGRLERRGDSWVLPLAEIDAEADETIPLSLTFTVLDGVDEKEKVFTMEAPYTVMADDGFIEAEVMKVLATLIHGADAPDMAALERMAKLSVYEEYRLNLNALSLRSAR